MEFSRLLDAVQSPALRAVLTHWNEARGAAAMPSWEQLKPSRIAPYLPMLWAYRFERESGEFIGRLAGSSISWGYEKNFRGQRLREVWSAAVAEQSHQCMLRVISEPAVCLRVGKLFKQADRIVEGERISLPLAGDGETGDGVLGVSAYDHPLRHLQHGPVELLFDTPQWFCVTASADRARQSA